MCEFSIFCLLFLSYCAVQTGRHPQQRAQSLVGETSCKRRSPVEAAGDHQSDPLTGRRELWTDSSCRGQRWWPHKTGSGPLCLVSTVNRMFRSKPYPPLLLSLKQALAGIAPVLANKTISAVKCKLPKTRHILLVTNYVCLNTTKNAIKS